MSNMVWSNKTTGKFSHKLCKIFLAAIVSTAMICSLAGCGSSSAGTDSSEGTSSLTDSAGSNAGSSAETADSSTSEASETEDLKSESSSPAVSAEDIDISHYADIEVKDYGTITVALSEKAAPVTVENFVSLAESGFYNGLTFHRIIDGFMIQGGDPNGDGTGGSGKTITGEFSENGIENNISHVRGAISMARSQDYDSASSQFFIVQSDSTYLDGQYAGFGFVTEGMDIVDKICADAQPTDNNGTIAKDKQPVITSITIREA